MVAPVGRKLIPQHRNKRRPIMDTMKTEKEAAAYLGNQPQTLAVWRSSGKYGLPFVRVGRAIRYRESDLKSWMERRTATSVAHADLATAAK